MYQKLIGAVILASLSTASGAPDTDAREQVTRIVSEIQRADYEGNRTALKKCYDELAPFVEDSKLASRVRYWRGFSLWRSAINGFNDSVDPKKLEEELKQGTEEFKAALQKDQAFVDAKVGIISCQGFILSMHAKDDPPRSKELATQILSLVEEAKGTAPDNPRLRWVLTPILWHQARAAGTGNEKIIENLKEGLAECAIATSSKDSVEPSWGKPELLMNLAYVYLNWNPPDLEAAESNARNALEIVPYWHYTRDILLPQILAAKTKAN